MTITTATATRQGTGPNNADAADVFRSEHGDVAAAVVDIAGHHPDAPAVASLLAQTIVRVAPGKGGVAALLTAGLLTADAGDEPEPQPDGVAVCATARTDESTAVTWIGDCQAWAWNGHTLTRLTTPHTVGEQLRTLYGLTVDTTAAADDIITTHLGHATPATVMSTTTTDPVVVLTTDGADYLPPDALTQLVAEHAHDPQNLAYAIVNATLADDHGYRDDVTVIVITNRP